jgi:hypothetical protein
MTKDHFDKRSIHHQQMVSFTNFLEFFFQKRKNKMRPSYVTLETYEHDLDCPLVKDHHHIEPYVLDLHSFPFTPIEHYEMIIPSYPSSDSSTRVVYFTSSDYFADMV